jgi:hypothetical protein
MRELERCQSSGTFYPNKYPIMIGTNILFHVIKRCKILGPRKGFAE